MVQLIMIYRMQLETTVPRNVEGEWSFGSDIDKTRDMFVLYSTLREY